MPSTEFNWSKPFSSSSSINENKQLSFIYQPGVGLYDKKQNDCDKDLKIKLINNDINEHKEQSQFMADNDRRSLLTDNDKFISSDEILSDKNSQLNLFDINISPNQENQHEKRKTDQYIVSNKKLRCSNAENLFDDENNRQKSKIITQEEQKQQSLAIKHRKNSNEKLHKQTITPIIKSIPMVRKSSSEKETHAVPSQGLLLCPKEDAMKKKKKKKIAPTITSSTGLLDDDSVVDSILFDEIQTVQQQWQQFLILTMEKELHINSSDGYKKKSKINKFQRTNEFLLAYENLYDFDGMKHWYPISR